MKSHRLHGRSKPYTQIGIRRLPCFRCGARAEHQWNVCADGGNRTIYRPLCTACDVALNELVLEWMGFPNVEELMTEYKQRRAHAPST